MSGNFLVTCPLNPQFIFLGAAGGVDQMSVRIHKAGQDDAAGGIKFVSLAREGMSFDVVSRTDSHDEAIAHEQRAIFYDAEVGKGFATARATTANGQQLRSACNEGGVVQLSSIMQEEQRA